MNTLRILVVDDEKITTHILSKMLEDEKHIVHAFHSGQEALDAFIKKPYDIVLSDINMPGMSGLEMIKEIRKIDRHVKIAIFTNFDNKQYMLDAIEYGVNQFFSKPFKKDHFLEVIRTLSKEILARRETKAELKRQETILHAIRNMAEHFLQHDNWSKTLHKQMQTLKEAARATSIFIFQNKNSKDPIFSEPYLSMNDDEEAVTPQQLHYRGHDLLDWKEKLSHGHYVSGVIEEFNEHQQVLIEAYKINTLLMLPIYAEGRWWGFLGIGNSRKELFHHSSIETLETAARIIGAAITNQKNLQNHEIRSAMFEHTVDGIIITDSDNKIVNVNKAFSDITGFTKKEALGKDPKFLRSAMHDKSFYQQMWDQLSEEGYWQGEIKNRRKNSELFIEWLSINSIKDQSGQVQNYIGIFSDVTAHRSSELEYAHLATHDALTGLANRVLLDDRLNQAINHAKRFSECVAIIFCDLDNFKPINDNYGHTAGDLALKKCSEYFTSVVRSEDTVCRYGGDEFIIVLGGINNATDFSVIADKVTNITKVPFEISGNKITLEMSAGISFFPQDALQTADLIQKADQAMYKAKKAGKNQVAMYNDTLNCKSMSRR